MSFVLTDPGVPETYVRRAEVSFTPDQFEFFQSILGDVMKEVTHLGMLDQAFRFLSERNWDFSTVKDVITHDFSPYAPQRGVAVLDSESRSTAAVPGQIKVRSFEKPSDDFGIHAVSVDGAYAVIRGELTPNSDITAGSEDYSYTTIIDTTRDVQVVRAVLNRRLLIGALSNPTDDLVDSALIRQLRAAQPEEVPLAT